MSPRRAGAAGGVTVLCTVGLVLGMSTGMAASDCETISEVPAVIRASGQYCLAGNRGSTVASGALIEIEADDVVVELNGFRLSASASGRETEVVGVRGVGVRNLTVRNGTIQGAFVGVEVAAGEGASSGHRIEDLHLLRSRSAGISVEGDGSVVRRNRVVETGGSTVTTDRVGIEAVGPGVRVEDNDVLETGGGTPGALAISAVEGDGGIFEANRIASASTARGSVAIHLDGGSDVTVSGNRIANSETGVAYVSGATGSFRGNLVGGGSNGFVGGTDAGQNYEN